MISFVFCFIFGLFFSFLILKSGINLLKQYFLDQPNQRSLHLQPIPRAGGLAFILPVLIYDFISIFINNIRNDLPLSFLCIPLIFISFLDDLIKVSSKYRYIFQLLTSFLILKFSNIELLTANYINNIFIFIFLMIFFTACINFTNFMDGSDGLVSGCMFIFFFTLILKLQTNTSIAVLIGSLAVFIFWNWYPAKVFMGDVGSTFLGIYFVANLFQIKNLNEIIGLLFICTPFFGDAIVTLFRRLFSKQNIFKAHRQHLYQRLYLGKFSKQGVAYLYIFQSLLLSLVYIKLNFIYEIGTIFVFTIIMYLLEIKYALSFEESMNNSRI